MGICIAYSGKLSDPAIVPALVTDLQHKAEALGWPYKTMETLMAEGHVTSPGLRGITLYPHPESEPLHFHFDHEGNFVNHFYADLLQDPDELRMMIEALSESRILARTLDDGGSEAGPPDLSSVATSPFFLEGTRYCWTKTQFAGAKVHAAVCEVLRHVQQRYAPELEVADDSKYYDSGDETKLETDLAYVNRLVDVTAKAFQTVVSSDDRPTTLDDLIERVKEEIAGAKDRLH